MINQVDALTGTIAVLQSSWTTRAGSILGQPKRARSEILMPSYVSRAVVDKGKLPGGICERVTLDLYRTEELAKRHHTFIPKLYSHLGGNLCLHEPCVPAL
eukprot:scaffold12472_cov115-Cylindrotheca_fusiformis.AAC.3